MLVESATRMAGAIGVPAQDRPPPPGQLPEFGNSSPVGLVVVLLLLLATVFLIRSMSKRITRLPESFDEPSDGPGGGTAGDTGGDAAGAGPPGPADGAGPRGG